MRLFNLAFSALLAATVAAQKVRFYTKEETINSTDSHNELINTH